MSYEFLKTSVEDRVAWLEYRRPPLNAIDWTMLREIPVALDELLSGRRRPRRRDRERAREVLLHRGGPQSPRGHAAGRNAGVGRDLSPSRPPDPRGVEAARRRHSRDGRRRRAGDRPPLRRPFRREGRAPRAAGDQHRLHSPRGHHAIPVQAPRPASRPAVSLRGKPRHGRRSARDGARGLRRASREAPGGGPGVRRGSGQEAGGRARRHPPLHHAGPRPATTTTPSPSSSRRRLTSRAPPTSPKASAPSSRSGRRSGSSSRPSHQGDATMARHTTGIFYHPSFSRRSYLTVGARLADFPERSTGILESDKVRLYEPEPVSRELLLKIHTPDLLERVGKTPFAPPPGTRPGASSPPERRSRTGRSRTPSPSSARAGTTRGAMNSEASAASTTWLSASSTCGRESA